MFDMAFITHTISQWLEANRIPRKGVVIVIEFPKARHAQAAQACVRMETQAMMQYTAESFASIETMNGIGLKFRIKQ